jgi:hypothetical protein
MTQEPKVCIGEKMAAVTTSTFRGTPHIKAMYGGDAILESSTSNGVKQY